MSTFHIIYWDNFKIFDEDGNAYYTETGIPNLEEAINKAKNKVSDFFYANSSDSIEDLIDCFKTMGVDPKIYSDKTGEVMMEFNSIEYLKKLYKIRNSED